MRNNSMNPISHSVCNVHAFKHLPRDTTQRASRPLRKIRDLFFAKKLPKNAQKCDLLALFLPSLYVIFLSSISLSPPYPSFPTSAFLPPISRTPAVAPEFLHTCAAIFTPASIIHLSPPSRQKCNCHLAKDFRRAAHQQRPDVLAHLPPMILFPQARQ